MTTLAKAEVRQEIDVSKLIKGLDEHVVAVRSLLDQTPASAVASNAALGATALILDALARSIEAASTHIKDAGDE